MSLIPGRAQMLQHGPTFLVLFIYRANVQVLETVGLQGAMEFQVEQSMSAQPLITR